MKTFKSMPFIVLKSVAIKMEFKTQSMKLHSSIFSIGRHRLIDCFYLCQTYAQIPKHLIRDNVNFLVLFNQDEMNIKHIYDMDIDIYEIQ